MMEKMLNMFRSYEPGPNIQLICPICQKFTSIGPAGRTIKWRLDCLNCVKTPLVKVVVTEFQREEQDRYTFTDFLPTITKMHHLLPDDDRNMYCWKFDYKQLKTTLSRIEKDCKHPIVHVFDEIIDINLDNFAKKTKMCLIFS